MLRMRRWQVQKMIALMESGECYSLVDSTSPRENSTRPTPPMRSQANSSTIRTPSPDSRAIRLRSRASPRPWRRKTSLGIERRRSRWRLRLGLPDETTTVMAEWRSSAAEARTDWGKVRRVGTRKENRSGIVYVKWRTTTGLGGVGIDNGGIRSDWKSGV